MTLEVSEHINNAQISIQRCLLSTQIRDNILDNISHNVEDIIHKVGELSDSFKNIGRD